MHTVSSEYWRNSIIIWNAISQRWSTNENFSILNAVMLVSVFFTILTIIVYMCIPELRRKFHGKCFMCLLFCVVLLFTSSAWVKLTDDGASVDHWLVYFTYISTLSGGLWMNVISFDLWLSFRWVSTNSK